MDDQTRMARFESMRRAPGLRKLSSNKKLFVIHKELQKQCTQSIKQHEFDARIVTSEVRRQQNEMERRKEKIQRQQETLRLRREKTHVFLDGLERSHTKYEDQIAPVDENKVKPQYMDMIKAIGHMAMPRSMKDRLRYECTVNPLID